MPPGQVKLVLTDVDGVLTDGVIAINVRGEETKHFSVLDGLGIRMLETAGIPVGFLSSRDSPVVKARGEDLGVRYCMSGVSDKKAQMLDILRREGIRADEACFIGDDLVDIPCLKLAGFPVAVPGARPEVKDLADYVTRTPGGQGAFREVAELILKASGRWEEILGRYQ